LLIKCFIIYSLLFVLLERLKKNESKMGDKVVHNFGWLWAGLNVIIKGPVATIC
jgi:hypothetical protein